MDSKNAINMMKRPGQAVKVIVEESGKPAKAEVCKEKSVMQRVRGLKLPKVHSKRLTKTFSLRTTWQRYNNIFDWGAFGGGYHC